MRKVALLIAVALVLVGVVWLQRRKPSRIITPPADEHEPSNPSASPALEGSREEFYRRIPEGSPHRGSLAGIVISSSGSSLAGATVSWTFLTASDTQLEGAWHDDDWGLLDREVYLTETDPAGHFMFGTVGADSRQFGSVIWATHPDYRANALILSANRSDWPERPVLVLESGGSLEVSVEDHSGLPVANALIDQFGLIPQGALLGESGVNQERVRRVLHRKAMTNEEGSATMGAFPGEQVLVASRAADKSLPWRGLESEQVVLTLQASFTVSGQVAFPDWRHLDYEGEQRITIAAQSKNLWRAIHTVRSAREGPWGPISLPVLDVDRYRVRLEGSPIIPVEEFFAPPVSGAQVAVDLVAELGLDLWFKVMDEGGQVIPEAIVKVQWQDPKRPEQLNYVERRSYDGELVNIWSVPVGYMTYEATAVGYVPFRSVLQPTSSCDNNYAAITLKRAGMLRGRCLHRGEPVRDFEVVFWQTSDRNSFSSNAFLDRKDGTFEIDTIPTGDFWITASSENHPSCDPQRIRVREDNTAVVTLDLPEGLFGQGVVVDEVTGLPVSTATVQLFIKGDVAPIARWGLPFPVNGAGEFRLDAFAGGDNTILLSAPGYSSRLISQAMPATGLLDWGSVPLARSQPFTIQLDSGGDAAALEGILISGRGPQLLPPRGPSSEGSVTYDGASSGSYELSIEEASGTSTLFVADLRLGEVWNVTQRIAGPNRLTVEILADSQDQIEGVDWVETYYRSATGLQTIRGKSSRNEAIVDFEGIDSPSVSVKLLNVDGTELGGSHGTFVDGRLHLSIPLGGEPFVLHVVDREGRPLSDVRVVVMDPQRPEILVFGGTDGAGRCELEGVPRRPVVVNLQHGQNGSHFGMECDATTGDATLVLDGEGRLDVLFLDRDLPLGGVSCALVDLAGHALIGETSSDDKGLLTIRNLALDDYRVRAWRSDCWPIETSVEAHLDGAPTTIQMRLLGELRVAVRAAGGLPVSGLVVGLLSTEFGVSVQDWIEQEKVDSAGLITDLNGQVFIERMPRGPYHWFITLPEGEVLQGELEVTPSTETKVTLIVP